MDLYHNAIRIGGRVLPETLKKSIKKVYSFPATKMGGSLQSKERLDRMINLLSKCTDLEGDVIECGVYRGGTAIALAEKLKEVNSTKTVYGMDTFEGLPFNSEEDKVDGKQLLPVGLFKDTNESKIQSLLHVKGLDNVELVKGLFTNTFPRLSSKEFCFAHVDVDLYLSIKQCIDFLEPRMVKGGIILFDDYNAKTCGGANRAIEEALGKENLIVLPKKQAYWIKK